MILFFYIAKMHYLQLIHFKFVILYIYLPDIYFSLAHLAFMFVIFDLYNRSACEVNVQGEKSASCHLLAVKKNTLSVSSRIVLPIGLLVKCTAVVEEQKQKQM